jgi:hypothetical protein
LETEGEERSLRLWSSGEGIPDEKWAQALGAVVAVTREYGFLEPEVVVDRPSDHEVSIQDRFNAKIMFGAGKNTIFRVTTGCHLTVEAHRRGTPPR